MNRGLVRFSVLVGVLGAVMLAVVVGYVFSRVGDEIEPAPPFGIAGAAAREGEAALVKYGCGACHLIAGVPGARGAVGPPLSDLWRRSYLAGNLSNTPENLVRWVMDPQAIEPGTAMPDLGVSEQDARAIAAYLYSLR